MSVADLEAPGEIAGESALALEGSPGQGETIQAELHTAYGESQGQEGMLVGHSGVHTAEDTCRGTVVVEDSRGEWVERPGVAEVVER